jgi:hypothetical protein
MAKTKKELRAEHEKSKADTDRDRDEWMGRYYFSPHALALASVDKWLTIKGNDGEGPTDAAKMTHLANLSKAALAGDQTQSIKMLCAQMASLDVLFHSLVNHAGANRNEGYTQAAETYLKLAFKAQAQARNAAEALNDILHPRTTTFVKQENRAENMQINNGPRVEKSENAPNELLEQTDGERLDTPSTGETIPANSNVETVATLDRAENKPR